MDVVWGAKQTMTGTLQCTVCEACEMLLSYKFRSKIIEHLQIKPDKVGQVLGQDVTGCVL